MWLLPWSPCLLTLGAFHRRKDIPELPLSGRADESVAPDQAMDEAMARVGRAITASAPTVAAGFGALAFSSFPALRDFGIVIVVDVVFALVVTLTVVPGLVHWLDRGETPARGRPEEQG